MTEQKTYSVYMHIFPNGKRYIGITSQHPVEKRWSSTGIGYRKCNKMWKAIQKYGWENVEHIVLYENLSKAMAESAEIALIKEYNTIEDGYNLDNGGNVYGSHTEETKKRIGDANRGKIVSDETREKLRNRPKQTGENNPFYGKHHTEIVKTRQADFMKGNQFNKGHHHTDEFKRMKSEQMHEKYKDGGHPKCRAVIMEKPNGSQEIFYSLRKAAEVANVSVTSLHNYIYKGKTVNGCRWRYKDA